MTKHEAAVIMAYTEVTLLAHEDFRYFHGYVEKLIGRPVFTHQLAELAEEIKEKAKPEFLKICQSLTEKTASEYIEREKEVETVSENMTATKAAIERK